MPDLPADLHCDITDAEVEIVSWNADTNEMALKVTKKLRPEAGLIRLRGVGFVRTPPRFKARAVSTHDSPFPDFLDKPDDGKLALAFLESSGAVFVVTADGVSYDRVA